VVEEVVVGKETSHRTERVKTRSAKPRWK
jgi:hypothetical protein